MFVNNVCLRSIQEAYLSCSAFQPRERLIGIQYRICVDIVLPKNWTAFQQRCSRWSIICWLIFQNKEERAQTLWRHSGSRILVIISNLRQMYPKWWPNLKCGDYGAQAIYHDQPFKMFERESCSTHNNFYERGRVQISKVGNLDCLATIVPHHH